MPVCEGSHSDREKIAISVFLAVFVTLLVLGNVPYRGVAEKYADLTDPIFSASGTRQVWNVFAPDPPGVVARYEVRFRYVDGSRSRWAIEHGNALWDPYADYRWLKLGEQAWRTDAAAAGLLVWAARERAEAKPLAAAELVRRAYVTAPPGESAASHAAARDDVLLRLGTAR